MNEDSVDLNAAPTISELYPELTPEQCKEADDNLRRYVEVVLRIYERIAADPVEYQRFKALTKTATESRMNSQPISSDASHS